MKDIKEIIKGHLKELINANEELCNERLEICKRCPLYIVKSYGAVCNNKLWINKKDEVSRYPREGYVRGCNCRLTAKARLENECCVIHKW